MKRGEQADQGQVEQRGSTLMSPLPSGSSHSVTRPARRSPLCARQKQARWTQAAGAAGQGKDEGRVDDDHRRDAEEELDRRCVTPGGFGEDDREQAEEEDLLQGRTDQTRPFSAAQRACSAAVSISSGRGSAAKRHVWSAGSRRGRPQIQNAPPASRRATTIVGPNHGLLATAR